MNLPYLFPRSLYPRFRLRLFRLRLSRLRHFCPPVDRQSPAAPEGTAGPYTPQAHKTPKTLPRRRPPPAKSWAFSSAATQTCLWTTHQPSPKTLQTNPPHSHKARALLAQARPRIRLAQALLARTLLVHPRPLVLAPALLLCRRQRLWLRPLRWPLWPLRRFRPCPAMPWVKYSHSHQKPSYARNSKMQKENASGKKDRAQVPNPPGPQNPPGQTPPPRR